MVLTLGPVQFANDLGVYALLALIPFFLVYLIRPRPKKLDIPSVMFLFKQAGVARYTKLFRNFIRDWVFLIQLLALLALIGVILSPFVWYDHDVTSQNTVIVIDASASSQVLENGKTRFASSIEQAKEVLGSSNTVILAKEVPLIGIQDATSLKAEEYLDEIGPRDTPTRLGDAIILAGEVLNGMEGRVVVFSDFVNTGGQDPETAKLVLESKGLIVDFVSTAGSPKNNIGIIDAVVDDETAIVYAKNYGDSSITATISAGSASEQLDLGPGEVLPFGFTTPPGITEVKLSPGDDFMLDNSIKVAGPAESPTNVLIITNNDSVFLENALRASSFLNVRVAHPPIVDTSDVDVFVIHNADPSEVLPGTFDALSAEVLNGKTLIVHAQSNMAELDLGSAFPYTVEGFTGAGPLYVEQSTQYTRNIEFGSVSRALSVSDAPHMTRIASVNGEPVLSIGPAGDGTVVYMGLLEDSTDFRLSPSYPIFWHELFKFLTDQVDASQLNHEAGNMFIFDGVQTVETPTETMRRASILLDYEGEYKAEDRTIVANLLSEAESAINAGDGIGQSAKEYELVPVREKRQYDLQTALILAAAVIMLFELLFIKLRGDL